MRLLPSIRATSLATTLLATACILVPSVSALAQDGAALQATTGAAALAVLEIKGKQITLSAGTDEGVQVGSIYTLTRNGQITAQLRITQVLATQSIAVLESEKEDAPLVVGDSVGFAIPPQLLVPPPIIHPSFGNSENRVFLRPDLPVSPLSPTPLAPAPSAMAAPAPSPAPAMMPVAMDKKEKKGFKLLAASGLVQSVGTDGTVTLSIGTQTGVREGDALSVLRGGVAVGTVRITEVQDNTSTGAFTPEVADTAPQVGDIVQQGKAGMARQPLAQRRNTKLDYLGVLAAAALVLATDKDTASSPGKAFVGSIEFSTISPFPGGGYSILPDGKIDPGGAMQVNIPVAYTPRRLTGVLGAYALQNRQGDSLSDENGRNGTLNLGVGFGLNGRGAWISRMVLSKVGLDSNGGDRAYNAQYQITAETAKMPAIAAGVQDFTNAREFSPFLVATKQIQSVSRPLFFSLGLGKGRFSGKSLFGGVSYAPIERLSLAAEYDGVQINLGASLALTRRLTLLGSYNDLSRSSDRPAGQLGRRYQVGGSIHF